MSQHGQRQLGVPDGTYRTAGVLSQPSGEGAGFYIPHFLLWLRGETAGAANVPVAATGFAEERSIPDSVLQAVIDRLRDHGLIRVHDSGSQVPVVSFVEAGAAQALTLAQQREDAAERGRYAQRAVLSWIFAAPGNGQRLAAFFAAPEALFLGQSLSADEVIRTVSWLAGERLLVCDRPMGWEAPEEALETVVSLTAHGVDCVLGGSEVEQYLARRRERERPVGGNTYMYAENIQQPVVGNHNTVHGRFTASTTDVATLVRQFGPALRLDDDALRRLLAAAEALENARQDGGDPDGDRRAASPDGLLQRVRQLLYSAPQTVGRELMLDTVTQTINGLLL